MPRWRIGERCKSIGDRGCHVMTTSHHGGREKQAGRHRVEFSGSRVLGKRRRQTNHSVPEQIPDSIEVLNSIQPPNRGPSGPCCSVCFIKCSLKDSNKRGAPRLLLRPSSIDGVKKSELPKRISLSTASKATRFDPGMTVRGLARIQPFSGPVMPGSYDFAFHGWFRILCCC